MCNIFDIYIQFNEIFMFDFDCLPCFRFPWLCSLREAGFRGRHRCGVALLSGILVVMKIYTLDIGRI